MSYLRLCGIFGFVVFGNVSTLGYNTHTTPSLTTKTNLKVCKHIISEQHGVILSPGYPDRYPRYVRCRYVVQRYSPHACEVNLKFNTFEVERMYFTNCTEDFLELQDGKERFRLCGTLPSRSMKTVSFPPDSDELKFYFQSTFHSRKGFEIQVKQLHLSCPKRVTTTPATTKAPVPCNRTLTGQKGLIRFPVDRDRIADSSAYTIRRSEPKPCLLRMDITTIKIPWSSDCSQNYLLLPDGQKLCGIIESVLKYIHFPPSADELVITSIGRRNYFKIQVTQVPFEPCDPFAVSIFTGLPLRSDAYSEMDNKENSSLVKKALVLRSENSNLMDENEIDLTV